MDIKEKLKEIEEHFENISEDDFELKLKRAGHGEIEHSTTSDYTMI